MVPRASGASGSWESSRLEKRRVSFEFPLLQSVNIESNWTSRVYLWLPEAEGTPPSAGRFCPGSELTGRESLPRWSAAGHGEGFCGPGRRTARGLQRVCSSNRATSQFDTTLIRKLRDIDHVYPRFRGGSTKNNLWGGLRDLELQ